MYLNRLLKRGKLIQHGGTFNSTHSHTHFGIDSLSAGTLRQSLDTSTHSMWTSRCVMERVILIDWHSKVENINDAPIWILRDILLNVR